MKKIGSRCEFERERNDDLMRAYTEEVSARRHIFLPDVFEAIVKKPSRRFWVSDRRAAVVLSEMFRGDTLDDMRPLKRKMFNEIFRRARKLKSNYPQLTMLQIAEHVVEQPAPEFYITPGSAKIIIWRIRKQRRKQQRNKR